METLTLIQTTHRQVEFIYLPVAQNYSAFSQERNRGNNTLEFVMYVQLSQSDGFLVY
jgi:hypothetical protein